MPYYTNEPMLFEINKKNYGIASLKAIREIENKKSLVTVSIDESVDKEKLKSLKAGAFIDLVSYNKDCFNSFVFSKAEKITDTEFEFYASSCLDF